MSAAQPQPAGLWFPLLRGLHRVSLWQRPAEEEVSAASLANTAYALFAILAVVYINLIFIDSVEGNLKILLSSKTKNFTYILSTDLIL